MPPNDGQPAAVGRMRTHEDRAHEVLTPPGQQRPQQDLGRQDLVDVPVRQVIREELHDVAAVGVQQVQELQRVLDDPVDAVRGRDSLVDVGVGGLDRLVQHLQCQGLTQEVSVEVLGGKTVRVEHGVSFPAWQ